MKTFLVEIIFADGSRKISPVGADWHDEFLKALKNKKAVMVRVWLSTRGVIKKKIVNRQKYVQLLKNVSTTAGETTEENSEELPEEASGETTEEASGDGK